MVAHTCSGGYKHNMKQLAGKVVTRYSNNQFIGLVPVDFTKEFIDALDSALPRRDVTVLSDQAEAELWVHPPLSRDEFEVWDRVFESVYQDLHQ